MKYFIDCEFIEGFKKPLFGKRRHFIDLISIAIVCEDGREYYAISNEFNPKDSDEWVKKNVLHKITIDWIYSYSGDGRNKALDMIEGTGKDGAIKTVQRKICKSNKQIANEVEQFCNPNKTKAIKAGIDAIIGNIDPNIEFYAYYADYDWVLFCSLFGRMIDLPNGFPNYCKDLKQILDETASRFSSEQLSKIAYPTVIHNVLEYLGNNGTLNKPKHLKKHKEYPKQNNEHNALDDARWNLKLYNFLKKINSNEKGITNTIS